MGDLVVTVPQQLWLDWIMEGDAAGEPDTGEEWGFYLGGSRPPAEPGDRLYIVAWGLLRGYAPITRVVRVDGRWCICRRGGAVACTIDDSIEGFRGWRAVWWKREDEKPFQLWKGTAISKGVRGKLLGEPMTGRLRFVSEAQHDGELFAKAGG